MRTKERLLQDLKIDLESVPVENTFELPASFAEVLKTITSTNFLHKSIRKMTTDSVTILYNWCPKDVWITYYITISKSNDTCILEMKEVGQYKNVEGGVILV